MFKFIKIFLILLIIFFILSVYEYYSSNKNIQNKSFNRDNIDQILKDKVNDIPILPNDTDNVIEFNNSIDNEINTQKKRNFWNLLKFNE